MEREGGAMDTPICEAGGHGMFFPAGGEWEAALPRSVRGVLYALALVYFFAGTAIVADVFMASIEQITGRRARRVLDGGTGAFRTQRVWNETVATLSLMALGSSAPEIFLSVIDIVKNSFHFGDLGCSTIVGSASFNLFIIVAVCLAVIPSGEVRAIKNLPAFYITAFFSMIAYLWMVFMLSVNSPDLVEVWEALATFLFFPLLIYVSYKVDVGAADKILGRLVNSQAPPESENSGSSSENGYFRYASQEVQAPEDAVELNVSVFRHAANPGPLGRASCQYHTEAMTAVPGFDYSPIEGTLWFEEGAEEQIIKVPLVHKDRRPIGSSFLLVLEEAEGDTGFCPDDDGGSEAAILTIRLQACGTKPGFVVLLIESFFGVDSLRRVWQEWKEQVDSVMWCHGSREEHAEASCFDRIVHTLLLPWKIAIALVMPPTCAGEGKVTFCVSLMGIAFVTACVSDFAELFGCVLNVPDIITASTIVALGTSMPDLFASISAARDDPTADASIVNVTGSNAVNVFLGLGVPWTVAAIYWSVNGRTADWEARYPGVAARISGAGFVVESGNLGFSVGMFCVMCVLALLLLHLRRRYLHAELGGPKAAKVASVVALVCLWLGWATLLTLQTLRWGAHGSSAAESTWVIIAVLSACIASIAVAVALCKLGCGTSLQDRPGHGAMKRSDSLDTEDSASSAPAVLGRDVIDTGDAACPADAAIEPNAASEAFVVGRDVLDTGDSACPADAAIEPNAAFVAVVCDGDLLQETQSSTMSL